MKPLICLTPQYDRENDRSFIAETYAHAVLDAGGIPVVLPIDLKPEDAAEILERMDGVLLPGGGDVFPGMYGENFLNECESTYPKLDELEIAVVRTALAIKKPVLGICRGMQIINTALGGTLYQDIVAQLKPEGGLLTHREKSRVPMDYGVHFIKLAQDSLLFECVRKESLFVNSYHHQAVKELAPGFKISAVTTDGVPEAIELATGDNWILGMQWHPEMMYRRDENARAIFAGFITRCGKNGFSRE